MRASRHHRASPAKGSSDYCEGQRAPSKSSSRRQTLLLALLLTTTLANTASAQSHAHQHVSILVLLATSTALLSLLPRAAGWHEDYYDERFLKVYDYPCIQGPCTRKMCSNVPDDHKYYLTSFCDAKGGVNKWACGDTFQESDCAKVEGGSCGGGGKKTWYMAGSARFGCGSVIRCCRQGKCANMEVLDGGPGCRVESRARKEIVDATPCACQHLTEEKECGWIDKFEVECVHMEKGSPLGQCVENRNHGGQWCGETLLDHTTINKQPQPPGGGGGGGGGGGEVGGADQDASSEITHFLFSPAELESQLVCKSWPAARKLQGWCGERYPKTYLPCPLCFVDNWCSPDAPWEGIYCTGGQMSGRVKEIDFQSKGIGGPIFRLLPFFRGLTNLNLKDNRLVGPIPGNIGGCNKLTSLQLHINSLSGALPGSIGNLKALTYLNVANNRLNGRLPQSIGGMANLRYFYAQHNRINGQLPASMGNWRRIMYAQLTDNRLSGVIPSSLCNYQATAVLMVDFNPNLQCYPQCLAKYSRFVRDNSPHNTVTGGKVLCCCGGCSYVSVTINERAYCPVTWPTVAPTVRPPNWGPYLGWGGGGSSGGEGRRANAGLLIAPESESESQSESESESESQSAFEFDFDPELDAGSDAGLDTEEQGEEEEEVRDIEAEADAAS